MRKAEAISRRKLEKLQELAFGIDDRCALVYVLQSEP